MDFKIRDQRKAQGLTQQELAGRIGVSKACLCRWENWREGLPIPSIRTLQRIAKALDVRIKELFEE